MDDPETDEMIHISLITPRSPQTPEEEIRRQLLELFGPGEISIKYNCDICYRSFSTPDELTSQQCDKCLTHYDRCSTCLDVPFVASDSQTEVLIPGTCRFCPLNDSEEHSS